jgi:hypothetical protein
MRKEGAQRTCRTKIHRVSSKIPGPQFVARPSTGVLNGASQEAV